MKKIPEQVANVLKDYPLGYRIKRMRNMMGWTQSVLAAKLGASQGNVSNWELGINVPNGAYRERIIQVFGLPLDFFIDQDIQIFKGRKEDKHG